MKLKYICLMATVAMNSQMLLAAELSASAEHVPLDFTPGKSGVIQCPRGFDFEGGGFTGRALSYDVGKTQGVTLTWLIHPYPKKNFFEVLDNPDAKMSKVEKPKQEIPGFTEQARYDMLNPSRMSRVHLWCGPYKVMEEAEGWYGVHKPEVANEYYAGLNIYALGPELPFSIDFTVRPDGKSATYTVKK